MPENILSSNGYELYGLAILSLLAAIPFLLAVSTLLDWVRSRILKKPRRRWLFRVALVANLVAVICAADAWLVEPNLLTVTRIHGTNQEIAAETGTLKIVHISDIHFTQHTSLTRRVMATISAEKPDLILATGDIHQLGSFDKRQLGEFLSSLCNIAPTFAVTGYDEPEVLRTASRGRLHLADEVQSSVTIRGTRVQISRLGMRTGNTASEPSVLRLVLAHCPDDVAYAEGLDAHWAFAGHTHGGQVRLPFWGAITTASDTGKRYEYGHYKVGETDFFVTRGLGMEPKPAPQVRFLCPPEIVVLTLSRNNSKRL